MPKVISRSHRKKPSSRQGTPILLSDIKHNSTCITLKLPLSLAYVNCHPQLDPLEKKRKKGRLSDKKHHAEDVSNIGVHIMVTIIILQKDMLLCIVKLEVIYKLSRILQ